MHVHAGEQHIEQGALGNKVRSPGMEPFGHAVGILATREEDDGKVVERERLADAQTNLVAVQARHVDVEKHKVETFLVKYFKCLFSRSTGYYTVPHL